MDAAGAKVWLERKIKHKGTIIVPGPNPKAARDVPQQAKVPVEVRAPAIRANVPVTFLARFRASLGWLVLRCHVPITIAGGWARCCVVVVGGWWVVVCARCCCCCCCACAHVCAQRAQGIPKDQTPQVVPVSFIIPLEAKDGQKIEVEMTLLGPPEDMLPPAGT
jgi:hypothetical protein